MDFNEYKAASHLRYAELARAVSAILAAAIGRENGYRLQLIKERAKEPASLRKKLLDRNMLESTTLDTDIKDLAGCRIVFYTDNDVARFLSSGIVEINFEVVDRKVHYPARDSEDATELYISNHFVVRLGEQRLALPEYAAFASMQCEVQVQTILNHSWSEMAHDTIYKEPSLGDFGAAHFKAIKERLSRVARKYLAPAGYEFQKIASDFERLVSGKKLDDTGALAAIAAAADNNERAEALRVFTEQVLSYYGDREGAYPRVVEGLMAGIRAAQEAGVRDIETEYGSIPGKTFGSILTSTAKALSLIQYAAPQEVFDAVLQLFPLAPSETERKLLLELGESLAGHNVHVWQQAGPAMQRFVTDRITGLADAHVKAVRPVLIHMLGEVLSPNAEGTTSTSSTISFHQASVVASPALRDIRSAALDQLVRMYFLSDTEQERRSALASMRRATDHPMRGNYGHELSRIVADDARRVTEFETRVASNLSLAARQTTEGQVLLRMRRFSQLPEWLAQQDGQLAEVWAGVVAAAQDFNASVSADHDYHIFKVLVGYDSVYPHAWADHRLDYAKDQSYRDAEIDRLLDTVSSDNFEPWYERIHRYAATESDDLATFPKFTEFIRRVATRMPELGFVMVDRLDERMSPFLPGMLRGLLESDQRERAARLIAGFAEAGTHLENIAWQFRFAKELDIALLRATLDSAMKHDNHGAVTTCILAAAEAYSPTTAGLVESVLLPAVRYLHDQGDTSWVLISNEPQ